MLFLRFELTADNNEDGQFLIGAELQFFDKLKDQEYLYCTFDYRKDSSHLADQTGLKEIWTEKSNNIETSFYAGDFKEFLKME